MDARTKLLISALIFALLGAAAFFLAPLSPSGGVWPGYQILLVNKGIPEADILSALSSAGIQDVISESGQQVHISDFSKLVLVSLPEARQRLSALGPDDPRLDAYLQGLGRWFSTGNGSRSYRIFYIANAYGAGPGRIASALGPYKGAFLLPEAGAAGESWCLGAGIVLCAAFAIYLILSSKRRRLLRSLILLPWLALSFRGCFPAGMALVWEAFFCSVFPHIEENYENSRRRKSLRPLLLGLPDLLLAGAPPGLCALGLLLLQPGLIFAVLCALGASFSGFCTALALGAIKKSRPGFIPVRLGAKSLMARVRQNLLSRETLPALIAAFLGLLLSLLPALFPAKGSRLPALSGISLPQPASALPLSAFPGPAEASRLIKSKLPDFLPDMADYLAHEAREEAVFYAPLQGRGDPFESLSVPAPGGTEAFSLDFDSSWAHGVYRRLPERGVERLLAAQGRFVRVALLPLGSFKAQPLAPREVILYIILVAPLLISFVYRQALRRTSGRREIVQSL